MQFSEAQQTSCLSWPQSILNGSEMGERVYHFDWAQTSLGPIQNWPQSLRGIVSTVLSNSFPMYILWGEEYCEIYNDAFIPLTGKNHPEMLGKSIRETWAEIWDDIVEPIFTHVRESGKPILIEDQHFPVLRFGYLEEAYCLTAYSVLRDDEGGVGGILVTITETTQQVLSKRRLKTLRDLGARSSDSRNLEEACLIAAKTLEESAIDIPFALIYLSDDAGSSTRLVATAGLPENHSAHLLEDALNPAVTEVNDLQQRYGLLPGGPWPESAQTALIFPLMLQSMSHPIGYLITGVSPRRELDEQYREFLTLVSAQVTTSLSNAMAYEQERKRAEALAELDRAKTDFFSNVSHEFRTPLTLMLGPLEDLLHNPQLTAQDHDQVEMIYRNGLRLLRLVNSLLDFSRIESGRVEATYHPISLDTYTTELASIFQSTMEKAGLMLTIDCEPLPEPVYVDIQMWEKIVLNLISNAFKFTMTGGVTVRLIAEEGHALLHVEDTGMGIAPEELPHVFERFHRGKEISGRSHEGTGIGLSLVNELVKLHGGTLNLHSVLGQGSTFTVLLPLGKNHLPTERIGSETIYSRVNADFNPYVQEALRWLPSDIDEIEKSDSVHRIIIADDNSDMRAYVKRLLEPYYEVIAVENGEVALAQIQQQLPDLLLTDVMMPLMDGFDLLHHIRENPDTQTLPVIMLSARAGEEANIEGLSAGADDYLVKPFSAKELLARVHSNLNMARIRREADETMRQAQKMQVIGQLAGGVAHDFNSLLTVLIGNLKLLEKHVHNEMGLQMLDNAFKATEQTSSLTRQLLAFARKQPLQRKNINLNELVQGIDNMLARTLGGIVEVNINLDQDLWLTYVDKNQLELALLNLAINARDAMPNGGTLSIGTKNISYALPNDDLQAGDYVSLSVTDTGTGMTDEVISHAFEPFYTTKDIGQGTGLGLSQVYGLAKQLDGTVRIQSASNQGTRVEIILPRSTRATLQIVSENNPGLSLGKRAS